MNRTAALAALCVFMAFSSCDKSTYTAAGLFEYRQYENAITITGYLGESKEVVIPPKINKMPVRVIANGAFMGHELTQLSLPQSVTVIHNYAFYMNKLSEITLPDTVTFMGDSAFAANALTRITLPANVDIQANSFYYSLYDKYVGNGRVKSTFTVAITHHDDFKVATVDNAVVEIIEYEGRSLELVIPETINGLPVVAIGDYAFNTLNTVVGYKLEKITFPETLTSIGVGAFFSNQLTEISLPESLITVESIAFGANPLESVVIPASVANLADSAFDDHVAITRR